MLPGLSGRRPDLKRSSAVGTNERCRKPEYFQGALRPTFIIIMVSSAGIKQFDRSYRLMSHE
jgi:hypothetical protein